MTVQFSSESLLLRRPREYLLTDISRGQDQAQQLSQAYRGGLVGGAGRATRGVASVIIGERGENSKAREVPPETRFGFTYASTPRHVSPHPLRGTGRQQEGDHRDPGATSFQAFHGSQTRALGLRLSMPSREARSRPGKQGTAHGIRGMACTRVGACPRHERGGEATTAIAWCKLGVLEEV